MNTFKLRGFSIAIYIIILLCDKVQCRGRNLKDSSLRSNERSDENILKKTKRELIINPYIVNGSLAPQGRYPYAVKVGGCGGSLIAKDVVLTAAHCKDFLPSTVVLGENQDDIEHATIIEILTHPDYVRGTLSNDVMLLKINRDENNMMKYPTILLNSNGSIPQNNGAELTVMGWGRLGENQPASSFLRHVDLKYITNEECRKSEGTFCRKDKCTHGSYKNLIQDDDLCAHDINKAGQVKDSCYGDSGSPLIMKGKSPDQDMQVGIVSWGFECGNEHFPGVYSRVSKNIQWIQRETCRLSPQHASKEFCKNTSGPPVSLTTKPTPSPTPRPTLRPTSSSSETYLSYTVKLDDHPEEHSWELYEIQEGNEKLILSKGNYKTKGQIVYERFNIKPGKYKFIIHDTYGDGLNVPGANSQLYKGDIKERNFIKQWFGNWGKKGEISFTIFPATQLDSPHFVTTVLKLNDKPKDIAWRLFEIDGPSKNLIEERKPGHYSAINKKLIQKINVSYGKSYRLVLKRNKNSDMPNSRAFLKLFSGYRKEMTVLGRINLTSNKNFDVIEFDFLDNLTLNSQKVGEKCYTSKDCLSNKCRKGLCRMSFV